MAQNWYGAGELWKKEVKSVRASAETRKEFYGDKALRKVGGKLLGDVSGLSVDDLTAKLKEHAEITKDDKILAAKWDPEKIGAKRYISDLLKDFFEQKCGSKRGTADALIALKFLNAELENVDLVREGETIEIENGILMIKSAGEVVARGAIMARGALPAGSPDALPRRTAVRKKSRSARAAVAATLPSVPPVSLAPPSSVPPPTSAPVGPTGAPIVPEPAGPSVAPPVPPPAAPVGPSAAPLAPSPTPSKTAPPTAATAPAPHAAPPAVAPPLPKAAPPEVPDAVLKKSERIVSGLNIPGYMITKTSPDPKNLFVIYEVKPKGDPKPKARLLIDVANPDRVNIEMLRPSFTDRNKIEEDPSLVQSVGEVQKNLIKELMPAPDVLEAKFKKRAQEVEDALKAEPQLKDLAHEIKLVDGTGPNIDLKYFKITLQGTSGAPLRVGFLGVFKKNPQYIVLEDNGHRQLGSFDNYPAFAHFAADPKNLTWGGIDYVPSAIPPGGLPPVPPAAPPAPVAAPVALSVAPPSAAAPPPLAPPPASLAPPAAPLSALPAAPVRPSSAPPGAVPPSATIDPFADMDAKATVAPPNPADDPSKITIVVDGAWKAKNWDDLDLATHLLLTNPKSTPEQKANAHLRLIDSYKARNKVDRAIESYTAYIRLKPQEVEKGLEGVRYAFDNKKYEEALMLQLNIDLNFANDAQKKALSEVAGDSAYEVKKYPAAKLYWERSLNLYTPADPERKRLQAKIDKLPKAPIK